VEASQEDNTVTVLTGTPARVAVLLTSIAVVLILLLANTVDAHPPSETSGLEYRVQTGDTLWEIAADVTPDGEDIRRIVFEIRDANDLDGSIIFPGQVLQLPVSG
jgi:LysM repeat protein